MKPFTLLLFTVLSFTTTSMSHPTTKTSSHGVSLHATIQIAPENVTRFLDFAKPIMEVVTAEPECQFFELYQSIEDPGIISWVENWDASVDWLVSVQLPKGYYKEYLEATEPMYLRPREMKIVNRVGPPFAFSKDWDGEKA